MSDFDEKHTILEDFSQEFDGINEKSPNPQIRG